MENRIMRSSLTRLTYTFIVLFLTSLLVSCGGSSSPVGTGSLSLGLTDAAGDYLHVFVTIREIQVNKAAEGDGVGSGWLTVMEPNKTIDLKDLENGKIFDLGLAELEAGHYNQMRLILGTEPDDPAEHNYANYLVIEGENAGETVEKPLKVPSGFQTGIKIVKGFEIIHEGTTALILDFDAKKSVVKAGSSGQWLLKPTIKVLDTVENSISGTVVDDNSDNPIPGATVSAQIYDANEVVVESTTKTGDKGEYKFFLPPDVYNVVVTTDNYQTACQKVEAFYYEEYQADFRLITRDNGTDIILTINVEGLADGESANLSIKQPDFDCGGENVTIEVSSDQVQNGSYTYTLPAGAYELVAYTTAEMLGPIQISSDTEEDLTFTPSAP
jgi:hypothetical protein